MHHYLKIQKEYFEAILLGDKTFEIRYNDRGYQKGDTVSLKEQLSSREVEATISYVSNYAQKENWVVFGIRDLKCIGCK